MAPRLRRDARAKRRNRRSAVGLVTPHARGPAKAVSLALGPPHGHQPLEPPQDVAGEVGGADGAYLTLSARHGHVFDNCLLTAAQAPPLEDVNHRLHAVWAADCAEHVLHRVIDADTARSQPPGGEVRW